MKRALLITVCFTGVWLKSSLLSALEVGPSMSDREIVERLTRLEEGQVNIGSRIDDVNRRIDVLRSEMKSRFNILK